MFLVDSVICKTIIIDIFDDVGFSRLKNKTLDLITEMRLENGLLNEEKTAARAGLNKGPSNKNLKGGNDQK